jgi:hypothetical protein
MFTAVKKTMKEVQKSEGFKIDDKFVTTSFSEANMRNLVERAATDAEA